MGPIQRWATRSRFVDDKTLRVLSGPYIGELMRFIIANNGHVEYVRGSGAATTFVPIDEFVLLGTA